jgi:hypothetical protein
LAFDLETPRTIPFPWAAALVALWLTAAFPRTSSGAEAAFSQDGARVYLLNVPRQIGNLALATVDVATGRRAPMAVPAGITARGDPWSLARSKSGFLLLLFEDSLWAYDPEKKTATKVRAAEPGNAFYDVACDSATGQIFLWAKTGLSYAEGGASVWRPVSVRRVDQFAGLTVLQKDHLVFAARGDAWLGRIQRGPAEAGRTFTTLLAYRFAPLATLETGNYTPAGVGAAAFAVTECWLYAHVRRMGGSGTGVLVRLPKPDPRTLDDQKVLFDVKARGEAAIQTLQAMEVIGANGYSASLCASPDGTTAFYRTESDDGALTDWVATDGQPPRRLP